MRNIVVIGGPNGAGKTTAARSIVPDTLKITEFVNADEIARGVSPFASQTVAISAGRIMLGRMHELIRKEQNFAFETTCAGRSHIAFLRRCKAAGWQINLLFLWLPSPEISLERVAKRVKNGGHSIPPDVVVRRYASGLRNLVDLYIPLVDAFAIYDNSDYKRTLVVERMSGHKTLIHDPSRWAAITDAAP